MWISLFATAAFGGEGIASFAKQSLVINLASIPFGKPVQTGGEFAEVSQPVSMLTLTNGTGIVWMGNAFSTTYHQIFTYRVLRYGFRDGKLATIRISLSSIVSGQITTHGQQELLDIQKDLVKAGPGNRMTYDDGSFRIQYEAMCAPAPGSLFVSEIQITPIEKKKSP